MQNIQNISFASYKQKMLRESVFDSNDLVYGLSRDHIQYVLGISVPVLMESVDRKTRNKILYEQYLFEQFLQSLRQAAGNVVGAVQNKAQQAVQQVQQTGQQVVGAAKTAVNDPRAAMAAAKTSVQQAVAQKLQPVKDAAGIFKSLGLLFQYPTLVKEFSQSVSKQVTTYIDPIYDFMVKAKDWLKDKTDKAFEYIKGVVEKSYKTISDLQGKFRSLQGWTKVMLGIGMLLVGKWVWDKVGQKLEDLKKKFDETAVGKAVGSVVDKAKEIKGKAEATKDKVIEDIKNSLTQIAKETFENVFGQAALTIMLSFAGPIGPFLQGISKLVENMGFIIKTITPITNRFIEKYNQITGKGQPSNVTYARAEDLQQSTTQKIASGIGNLAAKVGLREQRTVLLSDILYGNK